MTLTLEDIKTITKGALSVREEDGKFYFERFSEEQRNYYLTTFERSGIRTAATASVILDFYTDSESLAFNYEIDQLNYNLSDFLFFDVYEDEIMIAHVGEHKKKWLEGSVNITLKKGKKRVRVYFPNIFKMSISGVTLDEGASLSAHGGGRKALILGDSITQGNEAFFPSLTYANTLIRDLELDAVNQAIGGEVFRAGALGTLPLFSPEIITVAYGTNDWVSGFEPERAREYFVKLTAFYPDAKIFYISPIWRENGDRVVGGYSFSAACDLLKNMAREAGLIVIEGENIMPPVPDLYCDGLHPTDLGFTEYSKNLIKALIENGVND